jgi:hypothetical protein
MLKLRYGNKVERNTNQTVIGVDKEWLKVLVRDVINATMVGLYSDQVIVIAINAEKGSILPKMEKDLSLRNQ